MKIGFDAKFLRGNETGNSVFTRCLLESLSQLDHSSEYIVYLLNDRQVVSQSNFHLKKMPFPHRFPQMRQLLTFPVELRIHPVDIFHGIYTLPSYTRGTMLLSLIEFFWITNPEDFPMSRPATYQRILATSYAIKRADKIITPSDYIREQVLERYSLAEDRVATIHLACDDFYREAPSDENIALVLRKFNIERKYIFSVGNLHLRKNFDNLLEAYRILKSTTDTDHMLVITGDYFPQAVNVRTKRWGRLLADDIVFTGYVTREELRALYRGADLFAFPSLHEGFGIPLLEAMCSQIPIAASRVSSIPEVAGEAAVYFDPKHPEEISAALFELLKSSSKREALIERGKERLRNFSWRQCAEQTLEIYHELA